MKTKTEVLALIAHHQGQILYAYAADRMSQSDKDIAASAKKSLDEIRKEYEPIYGRNLEPQAIVYSERERVRHWIKCLRDAKDDWNRDRYRSFVQSAWADYRHRVDWFERCYGSRRPVEVSA